jgi:hypothetical protein
VSDAPFAPEQFVAAAGWQFATSMPEIPHEYTVRGKGTAGVEPPSVAMHDAFAAHVSEHGYQAMFYGWPYVYFELEGFKYWVVGDVINRERIGNDARDGENEPSRSKRVL